MSGRYSTWPQVLALAVVCGALALLSNSCSRAVKLSVVEPANLIAAPAGNGGHGSPRFLRADSILAQDDGLMVVTGDSLVLYSRVDSNHGLMRYPSAAGYEWKRRVARVRVMGFQPESGPWRGWEGNLRARNDSLEFLQAATHPSGLRRAATGDTLRMAPRQLRRVDLEQPDATRTVVTIALLSAAVVVLVGISIAASGLGSATF